MANIGAGIGGALGGAGTGAAIGTAFAPGLGTGIGAGVGGIAGLLASLFAGDAGKSTPARTEQVQRFGPEQQQAFSQILQQALSGLQDPSAGFAPIAQQARTQFEQQTVPGLAERFTALDGQRSSAFGQSLGQAGAGLEQGLAAQGAQFGQQQQGLLQQLLGQGLTPQFEPLRIERDPGFLESAGTSLAGGLGQSLPGIIQLLQALQQGGGGTNSIQAGATNTARQQKPFNAPIAQQARPQQQLGGDFLSNLGLVSGGF